MFLDAKYLCKSPFHSLIHSNIYYKGRKKLRYRTRKCAFMDRLKNGLLFRKGARDKAN